MALSRPYVLVLLAAVLSAATFVSLQSAGDKASANDSDAAPVVTDVPKPTTAPVPPKAVPPKAKAKANAADPAAQAAKAKKPAKSTGVPPRVRRALDSGKKVVLFFSQPGADDRATSESLAGLRSAKVAVFRDSIANLGRYRRVTSQLGITQAPALVVVGKSRKASLLQGFIDSGTLRQTVRDAR